MINLLKKYPIIVDDYNVRKNSIEEIEKQKRIQDPCFEIKRNNPEHIWHNRLFFVGLLVEGIAIAYYVGFKIKIPIDSTTSKIFVDIIKTDPLKIFIYLSTLLALLVHQAYIRNTLVYINSITTYQWRENPECFFFPDNLMFSTWEYHLRHLFFFALAIVAGEIPYILIVLEKVYSGSYMFVNGLTIVFISTCFSISLIVLIWDVMVLIALRKAKKQTATEIWKEDGLKKVERFTLSGILSFAMWGSLLLFIITHKIWWIETVFYLASGAYSVYILGYRLIYCKTNPFKGKY